MLGRYPPLFTRFTYLLKKNYEYYFKYVTVFNPYRMVIILLLDDGDEILSYSYLTFLS